jgi:hypothetical protein
MLNQQQQQPKGRWVYSHTLSKQIFIDEFKRIIDPNVTLLKSNAVLRSNALPKPVVAVPTPEVQKTAVCNDVAEPKVENKEIESETIQKVPSQPVVEKRNAVVPAIPDPQPAVPSKNSTTTESDDDDDDFSKENEERTTIRAPFQAPWTKPEMVKARNPIARPQVPKVPEPKVKKSATGSFAAIAQKPRTRKAKTTITVDNQGAYSPARNQSERQWSNVKRKSNYTPRRNNNFTSNNNNNNKGGYRNRRYITRTKLLGRNWADRRAARDANTNTTAAASANVVTRPTSTPYRPATTSYRNTRRNVTTRRAPAPAPAPRRPTRRYTVPANAHKLVPPITLDKLQGSWINSRNQEVEVRGNHYAFRLHHNPLSSGRIVETDEEFLVHGWILQKSGNVVLWYLPGNENITWRRPAGYSAVSATSEAVDFASKDKDYKVVLLNHRTGLYAGCNLASRKVKTFEKDEPLVVDKSTRCTLGANDNNAKRIKVVYPCEGWITCGNTLKTFRDKV